MWTRTLVAAVALVAAAAAGCSKDRNEPNVAGTAAPIGGASTGPATPSPAAPSPATPTGTAGTATPAGAPGRTPESTPTSTRCHTSELALSFSRLDAGAGQRSGILILTNTAGRTCTIYGFGGLQPLDAARRQLPLTLERTGPPPTLLRVEPGAAVGKRILFPGIPAGITCVTPAYLKLIPPDETDPLVAKWPWGDVCGDRIFGQAYTTGTTA